MFVSSQTVDSFLCLDSSQVEKEREKDEDEEEEEAASCAPLALEPNRANQLRFMTTSERRLPLPLPFPLSPPLPKFPPSSTLFNIGRIFISFLSQDHDRQVERSNFQLKLFQSRHLHE